MNDNSQQVLFHGPLAEEYAFLQRVCPALNICAEGVARVIQSLPQHADGSCLLALELGCGTGLSAQRFLSARRDLKLHAIDSAGPMIAQAQNHLQDWCSQGRLTFQLGDMVEVLSALPSGSYDVIVSNYALHNLLESERQVLMPELVRVLSPGGHFINGDRYGMDDPKDHLSRLQDEVRVYFEVFPAENRLDLLEAWVLHVLSDESPDRALRLNTSLELMKASGFASVDLVFRDGINAILWARTPGS